MSIGNGTGKSSDISSLGLKTCSLCSGLLVVLGARFLAGDVSDVLGADSACFEPVESDCANAKLVTNRPVTNKVVKATRVNGLITVGNVIDLAPRNAQYENQYHAYP